MGKEDPTVLRDRKQRLRRKAILARRALSAEERRRRSRLIWERCRELIARRDPPLLCSFIGFGEEVETARGLQALLQEGRRIAVPVMGDPGGGPSFSELFSWGDLEANPIGILEPRPGMMRIVPAGEIPLFLVPGLAFDAFGGRLGYGLGFYDRALAGTAPEALAVGLAFDLQVVESVPVDGHDRAMDMIVTEHRLIETPLRAGSTKEVH